MVKTFSIRNTVTKDYDMICDWWKAWNFPILPLDVLPNNGNDGVIVYYDGIPVCVGFLYATSSPSLFWCEWIVSNLKVRGKDIRKHALVLLINSITDLAKQMGAKLIFTSLKNKSLLEYFKTCGYSIDSSTAIEMIKIIR